jgi:peptidoglycan-N-acetylglucosamine deacetylase
MLNYRTSRTGLIIILTGIILSILVWKISLWWVLPAIFAFMALTAWGSFRVNSQFYLPVICKGEGQKKIALTFDDGPDPSITPRLLDLLKKYNAKATFFLIGSRIEGNAHVVRRLKEEGHLIGNHTYSHQPAQPFWPWKKLYNDLLKTQQLIEKTAGIKTRIFRPPFGVTSPPYAKALEASSLKAIGWSNRSLDTMEKDPVKIFERVKKQLKEGDIILFHDTDEKILAVIELLLNHVAGNGIKVVQLDELLKIKPYANS